MAEILVAGTYPGAYFDKLKALQDKEQLKTKANIWKSTPRNADSDIQEVLTFDFADRSSITSISMDVQSAAATYEFWYYDSNNNRLPLLRDNYNQLKFTTASKENWEEWQRWSFACMPCIATKLELRMKRVHDNLAPSGEYSLAVRKLAIRRNVYTREQAALVMHDSVDMFGNIISKTVKDWQPEMAIDGSSDTFWKSEPQISQDAVVCLYIDIRDQYGQAQFIDNMTMDPVYSGSQMNIYYSTDDTKGNRLVPFSAYDFVSQDSQYLVGQGLQLSDDNSFLSVDMVKSQMDKADSWMVCMDWFLDQQPDGNRHTIFMMDSVFTVVQTADSFEFTYLTSSGEHSFSLPFPCEMKYFQAQPIEDNIETEVRLSFGIDRSDSERIVASCRIINVWSSIGDTANSGVESDEQNTIEVPLGYQMSTIEDGIKNTYQFTPSDGVTINMQDKEIAISPNTVWHIPVDKCLDKLPLEQVDGEPITLQIDISYRTDPEYIWGARLQYGEDPQGMTRWWVGNENGSASRLAIDGKLICTNVFWDPMFADGGRWNPEQFDGTGHAYKYDGELYIVGQGRCRNLEKPAAYIQGDLQYVFSAIPTFPDGMEWYKDYKLWVYDGLSERFVATPTMEVESGKRCTITFTAPADAHLLSFGFVGGNNDGDVVQWSKPIVCTVDDWKRMQDMGLDWFDATTSPAQQLMIDRYCPELNINVQNDPKFPLIAQQAGPAKFAQRPFPGYMVLLNPGYNSYPLPADDDWVFCKGGSSFAFSFYMISDNGFASPTPYFEDNAGTRFFPDKYTVTDSLYGWQLVYARVTIPPSHEPEYMHFGILHREPISYTYIGDLHVYDNAMAFDNFDTYATEQMVVTLDHDVTVDDVSKFVLANISDMGSVYVSAISIKVLAQDVSDVLGDEAKIGDLQGILSSFNIKQEAPSSLDKDKYLQNPDVYMSPDNYDASSTMSNSLVYAKFGDENVVRGGVADAIYEAKEWTPILIGSKLAKTTYNFPMAIRAKYLKLEFSQLTAVQYPLESDGITQTYATFPKDVALELDNRYELESTSNKKQSVDDSLANITERVTQQFEAQASTNPNQLASVQWNQYWNPDVSVLNGKIPLNYIPGSYENSLFDIMAGETTSSTNFTGTGAPTAGAVSSANASSMTEVQRNAAEYMIYDAYASGDLLAIAREYDLKDWAYSYDTSAYADDSTTKATQPGRMPGFWVLPGQQTVISNQSLRQILSNAKVDVVQRTSTNRAEVAVRDTRSDNAVLGVIGPKGFSRTCVHWYEYITETRTQSIAYFVAIRELKLRVIDLTAQHDNTAWKLYSMALPIWHINGGYLTKHDIFVPDFSTGNTEAVAITDPMKSQSYFRTIKVLSVNRDSLVNRTYFPLGDTEGWHGPDYWYEHPELNCTWADDTEPDPTIMEDNGGAWASRRFAWGESWTNGTTIHKEWNVWYDGELVKHIIVRPQDVAFDANGNQIPLTITLGEIQIPFTSMVKLGAAIYSLKRCNSDGTPCECRIQLMSGRFGNQLMIDEPVDFDDRLLGVWQAVESSRQKLTDMQYECKVLLQFNHFEQLDIYIKSGWIETGTMMVEARNTQEPDGSDWEDITPVVGRKDSIYTFKQTNNDFQLRITMTDPQDWFSSIIVIPLYIPYEDAIDYYYDGIKDMEIVLDTGEPIPDRIEVGKDYAIGVRLIMNDGTVSDYVRTTDIDWMTSDRNIARVSPNGALTGNSEGQVDIYATVDGVTSTPLSVEVYRP